MALHLCYKEVTLYINKVWEGSFRLAQTALKNQGCNLIKHKTKSFEIHFEIFSENVRIFQHCKRPQH